MVCDGVVLAIERETRTGAALVFQIEHGEHHRAPMLVEPVEHAGNRKSAGRNIRNTVLIHHLYPPIKKERANMTRHYNGKTMYRPDFCHVRYIAIGGEIYRNTAADPDAPILLQIVPQLCPAQLRR